MKQLFAFGRLADDSQSVLTAIQQLALVGIELPLDGRLCIPTGRFSGELGIAAFADSEHRNIPDSLYDPKIALGHVQSLAHREGWA
jgi:hypothetical protein